MRSTLLSIFFFLCLRFASGQSILHVTPTGAGTRSGNSWGNALPGIDLPGQLPTAQPGTQFWIAAGMYKPTTTTDRTTSFSIASGTSVYGGFVGTETSIDQRAPNSNETVLSGEIGVSDDPQDNSLHVVSVLDGNNPVVIDGLTVTGGRSRDGSGAGIYVAKYSPGTLRLTIAACRIMDNVLTNDLTGGGGIYAETKAGGTINVTIKDCFLTANRAGYGGGYCAQMLGGYIETRIENTVFANNTGNLEAGAVSHNYVGNDPLNSLTVTNCQFSGNTAFAVGGAVATGLGRVRVTNCSFTGNRTTSSFRVNEGGAIASTSQDAVFRSCQFVENTTSNASGRGGALANNQSSPAIINCAFTANNAYLGSGIFNDNQSNASLTNCLFVRQRATSGGEGSALYSRNNSQPTLLNCTLTQNVDDNYVGPIATYDSPLPVVINCIFWNNTGNLRRILPTDSYRYSLVQDPSSGIGNLIADPLFVDPANGDFRLKPNSPAINAGDPNPTGLPVTDLAGQMRVQGGRVDIGAYEFTICFGPVCLPITVVRSK